MRTTLPPSELDRDLVLRSSEGGDLGNAFSVTRELNRAPDVVCSSGADCAIQSAQRQDAVLVGFALLALALLTRRSLARAARRA